MGSTDRSHNRAIFKRRLHGRFNGSRRLLSAWYLTLTQRHSIGPRLMANSVPKSGTHLVRRCLDVMPGIVDSRWQINGRRMSARQIERMANRVCPGYYVWGHMVHKPELAQYFAATDFRMVLVLRDPRDVAVSHYKYLTNSYIVNRLHPYYRALPDDDARLMATIMGIESRHAGGLEPLAQHYRNYSRWLNHGAHLIRFEDLVGEKGGGSGETQRATVANLAAFLGIQLADEAVTNVADQVYFQQSNTFRKGQIGDWRNEFRPHHRKALHETFGPLLGELGYKDGLHGS